MPGFYIVHITRGSRIGDTSMGIFLRNIGKKIPNGSQSLRSCWYSLEALRQHWLSWEVHVTAELYSQLAHLVPWRVIQPSFEEPCAPRMWIFFFYACWVACCSQFVWKAEWSASWGLGRGKMLSLDFVDAQLTAVQLCLGALAQPELSVCPQSWSKDEVVQVLRNPVLLNSWHTRERTRVTNRTCLLSRHGFRSG